MPHFSPPPPSHGLSFRSHQHVESSALPLVELAVPEFALADGEKRVDITARCQEVRRRVEMECGPSHTACLAQLLLEKEICWVMHVHYIVPIECSIESIDVSVDMSRTDRPWRCR